MVVVVVVALAWCYMRLSATFPAGSDGASNALEAWDMLHGNWLLHGWTLTDVSFYTTELPEYAGVELARGLNPGVIHVAAGITYTLLVLTAAVVARGRARGREGWARALITVGIMVAPQLGNSVHVLLAQPDHTGTQVLLLLVLLLVDRAPLRVDRAPPPVDRTALPVDRTVPPVERTVPPVERTVPPVERTALPVDRTVPPVERPAPLVDRAPRSVDRAALLVDGAGRWWRPLAVCGLLAVAIVADKIAIMDAAAPLAFVCLLHAIWTRKPGAHLFEVSLAAAAGVAVGTALLLLALVGRVGGFTLLPVQTRLTTPAGLPGHLALAWHGVLSLYGADVTTAASGPQTVLAWLHAPGIALAAAAFAVTAWRVPSPRDVVGDVLAVAIVVNLAGYVASIIPATPFDTREMVALLPFGAVLAGRVFGSRLSEPRHPATAPPGRPRQPRARPPRVSQSRVRLPRVRLPGVRLYRVRPAVAVLVLVLAGGCQLGALGYGITRPAGIDPEAALAQWLLAHDLTSGLGTFSEDNVTTLDSGGRVRLRTVSWQPPTPGAALSPGHLPLQIPEPTRGDRAQPPPQATQLRQAPSGDASAGGAVPRLYQSSAAWYDPRTQYANFVVTGTADGTADLIPRADILGLAGPPARTYHFQSFTIMVWNANLLAELGTPASRIPGDIGRP